MARGREVDNGRTATPHISWEISLPISSPRLPLSQLKIGAPHHSSLLLRLSRSDQVRWSETEGEIRPSAQTLHRTHAPARRLPRARRLRRRPRRVPAPTSRADAGAGGGRCGRRSRERVHGGAGAAAADVLRPAGDLGGGEQLRGRAGGVPADGAQVPPGRVPAGRRQGAHPPLHPGAGGLRDALRPQPPHHLRPRPRPRRLPPRLLPRRAPPRRLRLLPPGAGREVWLEDVLGRPNIRAEEAERGEGRRREPILGSSDAKKKGRTIVTVLLGHCYVH